MKKFIRKLLKHYGYNIIKNNSFDNIFKSYLGEQPTIFDVGANKGQSIQRFQNIFEEPEIHSFEPIKFESDKLFEKFKDKSNIIINNYAVGDINEFKKFNISKKTGSSSFNKKNKNSRWLDIRTRQTNISKEDIILDKVIEVEVIKLDDYCKKNNINNIDLLKIDTEGYEDKVLQGSLDLMKSGKISVIFIEIQLGNVYDKYLNFLDIEKYLIPNNFRLVAQASNSLNLIDDVNFSNNLIYFNKKKYDILN